MADLATAKTMREQDLVPLGKAILQLRDAVTKENREWTAEENEKWSKLNKDYESLKGKIEKLERTEKIQLDIESPVDRNPPGRADFDGKGKRKKELLKALRAQPVTDEDRALAMQAWARSAVGRELKKKHERACTKLSINPNARYYRCTLGQGDYAAYRAAYLRGESRALSVTQFTAGAATVPEGFVQNLEEALLQFGGIRLKADVMRTTSGNDLPWPTLNDTSNKGAILSENTTVTSQDVPFGQVVFHAYKYTSKLVLVPVELLEDSAFDLSATLGRLLGIRIGRIQSDHFTTGTGASQPTGIVTASTSGATAASTSAIAGDDIYALKHSVDPAYRSGPGVAFMMNDQIMLAVKKIKDGTGRYLWQASLAGRAPDTLDSDPVVINQSMVSTISSGNKTMLYGDISKYKIRDVTEFRLRRLVERYADSDQVGFVAFMRGDGNLLDAGTHPVKYLVH